MTSTRLKVPVMIHTPRTAINIGISYAVNCAAERIPPSKVYLLLDDHPAKNTPRGATPNTAIMNSTLISGLMA